MAIFKGEILPSTYVPESSTTDQASEALRSVMVSDQIDQELLNTAGGQLKVVATFTTGTDHIDL